MIFSKQIMCQFKSFPVRGEFCLACFSLAMKKPRIPAREAERRRAQVLLLGLDAFIVTREEPNGGVGHRVRVGPFVDQSRMVDAKKRLRQGKVLYDIIRVTG